jgi:hypothetical protein
LYSGLTFGDADWTGIFNSRTVGGNSEIWVGFVGRLNETKYRRQDGPGVNSHRSWPFWLDS